MVVPLERGVILPDSNMHIHVEMNNIKVSDLVDDKGEWDWNLLNWLPVNLKMKIAAILPPMNDNCNDKFVITTDEEGNFLISQMYNELN